jgi:hypothetical protein
MNVRDFASSSLTPILALLLAFAGPVPAFSAPDLPSHGPGLAKSCMRFPSPDSSADSSSASTARIQAANLVSGLSFDQRSALLALINQADAETLLSLDGIAAGRAVSIQAARPFASLEDLVDVKGIGLATFSRILASAPQP